MPTPVVLLFRAAFVAAVVLTVAGCGKEAPPPPPSKAAVQPKPPAAPLVVRVGFAAPLSGSGAHIGIDARNGAQLAIDRLNAGGEEIGKRKVTFELIVVDDEATPAVAAAVAQKLVDAKVVAVVGHINSGASIEASRVYAEAGIPQLSPASTHPQYTRQGYSTTFRLVATDDLQAPVLALFALDSGAKKIAVVDDATLYGKGLADAFAAAARAGGAKIVARESLAGGDAGMKTSLGRIQAAQPDVVMCGSGDVTAGTLLRQLRTLGVKARFLGADAIKTPRFITLAGKASEGAVASAPGIPRERLPGGDGFAQSFRQKFNAEVELFAPMAYDAVNVIAEAMRRAGAVEPARFLPELGKVQWRGVSGAIAFDANGDLREGPITISSVNDGRWEPVQIILMAQSGAEKK